MFRPTIKNEHLPVRHGTDSVRIGGGVPGIAVDIPDPDGWVWALVSLLDGTRTVDHIVTELVHRFPARSPAEVIAAVHADLGKLVEAGFVQDGAEAMPEGLTAGERERYSRGRVLWRWMDRGPRRSSWDVQLLLRQARVVMIGVGGVGATAALALALSGVGELHLVEPDVVELSNLNRQVLFTERDVGRPKVDAAVARLREHNRDITITGEALTITGPAALAALAARFDVMVLGADRPQDIRSWTNQGCVRTGTVWVHGGYHGPRVTVGLYRPGTGPCYDCADIADQERRAGLPPRTPARTQGVRAPSAANAVSAGIAGQLVAHATMSLITGTPRLPVNQEYALNLVTLDGGVVAGPTTPRPDCPTCGPQAQAAS
jgi:molybdopterin/thiamine biosynthesis adenylyltransferase